MDRPSDAVRPKLKALAPPLVSAPTAATNPAAGMSAHTARGSVAHGTSASPGADEQPRDSARWSTREAPARRVWSSSTDSPRQHRRVPVSSFPPRPSPLTAPPSREHLTARRLLPRRLHRRTRVPPGLPEEHWRPCSGRHGSTVVTIREAQCDVVTRFVSQGSLQRALGSRHGKKGRRARPRSNRNRRRKT